MRKIYIDNIKWITAVLAAIYHVIYMFNGVITYGVIGPFSEYQPQDVFQPGCQRSPGGFTFFIICRLSLVHGI